jgi:hypothetical protein
MATYFKYAERSAESQINWAEVGKNMTDMLQEQERIRDEKISALDAATRELGEKLANPPQGEHKSANQWALEYGDNASEYMLMQEKLFKSGKMKTKDYLVSRQNLVDGTKQAFNLTKEFQETFKMKMDRYKNGDSQDLELFLNAQAEKFGDFTKSQLYINPTDGSVNVAMKERRVIGGKEVFVMNQNPNEFTTISSLRNTIAGTYDKFDTNAVSTAFADALGKEETASIVFGTLSKGGAITTEEDITSRTDLDADGKTIMFKFIDAENQFINASLENPYDRLSVLTNTKKFAPNGKQYTFTYDEADAKANPEKVLLKVDSATGQPTPEFSDEQMKVSNEAMRTEVRAKYDYKKGISPTAQAQLQESSERARTGKENESVISNIAKFYNGDDVAVKEAADFVRGLNPNIDTVKRTGDNIEITFKDGRGAELIQWKAEDGSLIPIESWITANTNFFLPEGKRIADVNKIVARAGIDKNRTFNPESKGFSAGTVQEKEDVPTAFKRISQEKSGLKVSTFVADNEKETVKNLRSVISSLKGLEGFTLSEASPGFDVVELKDEKGNIVLEFDLDELDAKIAQGYVNQLLETASNRTKIEDQAIYVGKGRKQSEPQRRTSSSTSNQAPR